MDKELERFKTEIDLREFAASLGFEFNRRDKLARLGGDGARRAGQDHHLPRAQRTLRLLLGQGQPRRHDYRPGQALRDEEFRPHQEDASGVVRWSRRCRRTPFAATPLETTSEEFWRWHGCGTRAGLPQARLAGIQRCIPSSLFSKPEICPAG